MPAISRAIGKMRESAPALLEFITEKAVGFSVFPTDAASLCAGAGPALRAALD